MVHNDFMGIWGGSEKESQVQMVKYRGGIERNQVEKKMSTALACMGEVIANPRRLKLEENIEANLITGGSISKVQETNKILEICRAICEFPEKPSEIELRKKR